MTAGRPIRSLHLDPADRPFIVIWEVTRACQLVCAHCRADAVHQRSPLELDTGEGRALLHDIAGLGAPRPIVVLTGRDPLERPDMAEIVAQRTPEGLRKQHSTSVTPPLTPAVLTQLSPAGAQATTLQPA